MRRVWQIFIVALFISACSNDTDVLVETQTTSASQTTRSVDEAIEIANNAIGMLDEGACTRSFAARGIDKNNIKTIITPSTRSTGKDT